VKEIRFTVGERSGDVSALFDRPRGATACYVLAHGAGAGMRHAFMESIAARLAARKVATFRYQFPYVEAGRRAPSPAPVLQKTVRRAVEEAGRVAQGLPLLAGGKSMGGRMTSLAAAKETLPGVRGLVFLGFPLHAPAKPGRERGEHLAHVGRPMLFVQGTRDKLADLSLLRPLVDPIPGAEIHVIDDGDHSFHVPKRSGRTDEEVLDEIADRVAGWARTVTG